MLEEKIELVKTELLKNHPDCSYTVKILLWDDGTDSVQCQHGDEKFLYFAKYYDGKLSYEIEPIYTPAFIETKEGTEFYVVTEEQFDLMFGA